MELLILFAIAAIGGFWWVNYAMKKNEEKLNMVASKHKNQEMVNNQITDAVTQVPAPVVETKSVEQIVEPTKCGCGRSPTGFCVDLHKLSAEEWAVHADNIQKKVNAPTVQASAKEVKRTRKPTTVNVEKEVATKKPRGRKPNLEKSVESNTVPKKKAELKKSVSAVKKPRARSAQ